MKYHNRILDLKKKSYPADSATMVIDNERRCFSNGYSNALADAADIARDADMRIAKLEAVAKEALKEFEWIERNQMGGIGLKTAERLRDVLGVPTLFVLRLVTLDMGDSAAMKFYYSSDTDSWVTDFDRATRFTKHGKIAHEGTTGMKGTVWEKVK